jgi:hypothetical protein
MSCTHEIRLGEYQSRYGLTMKCPTCGNDCNTLEGCRACNPIQIKDMNLKKHSPAAEVSRKSPKGVRNCGDHGSRRCPKFAGYAFKALLAMILLFTCVRTPILVDRTTDSLKRELARIKEEKRVVAAAESMYTDWQKKETRRRDSAAGALK